MDGQNRFTLYTYENKEEFDKFFKEKAEIGEPVLPYAFNKTFDYLVTSDTKKIFINITNFVNLCKSDRTNSVTLYTNTYDYEKKDFIIQSSLADETLNIFHDYFDKKEPLYQVEKQESKQPSFEEIKNKLTFNKTLYTYKDKTQYFQIESYLEKNNSTLINLSNTRYDDSEIESLLTKKDLTIDISIIGTAIEKEPSTLIYLSGFLEKYHQINFIVKEDLKEQILNSAYFFFKEGKEVRDLFPEIQFIENENPDPPKKHSLFSSPTILEKVKKEQVFSDLDNSLFGQHKFKTDFKSKIESFVLKNKIGRNKVFSVFLLGNSGLGKTEVARIINKSLNPNFERIVKINFGNYSGEHSLSSLIGSPRGYHGSEEGELIVKMKKAHGGVLLCDEFEKAHRNVILFFLDLLENGNFSDSQGEEWDLNGYIIIFTSNASESTFQKFPAEFKSRLDLIHKFSKVEGEDKKGYIDFILEELKIDMNKVGLEFPDISNSDTQKFLDTEDLRKVKRDIEDEILGRLSI